MGHCEAPRQQLGVQCLAQGHFDMRTGKAGDQTANLVIKGPHYLLTENVFGKHDNSEDILRETGVHFLLSGYKKTYFYNSASMASTSYLETFKPNQKQDCW